MKWKIRNLKRLYRLMFPEQSVKDFIQCVGAFWLWRHGVKREVRIRLWKSDGWYCPDFCIPQRKLIVEVKGGWQKYYDGDVARDQKLIDKGWRVIRVSQADIQKEPRKVKRYVRQFLKG